MSPGTADEAGIKTLIKRYAGLLFGYCLSCGAYTREQAFQITVLTFAETLHAHPRGTDEQIILRDLFRSALATCARTAPAGSPGLEAFGRFSTHQQPPLSIVRGALMHLPQNDRSLLLLRDQCHLPFETIADATGSSVRETRSACLAARESFRAKVQELLEAHGKKDGM